MSSALTTGTIPTTTPKLAEDAQDQFRAIRNTQSSEDAADVGPKGGNCDTELLGNLLIPQPAYK
ncbi:MAG: hypothetical protein NTU53_05245 [Planctomycetota bacterium]|nr:hypothetical protein [Planctomycetota bacterium]